VGPIRALGATDYEALLELWLVSGLDSLRPQGRDGREAFVRQLERGQAVFGIEEEGRLIAAVAATDDTRKGWINRLVVHPDHRRRGHGLRLVRAAEESLRRRGLTIICALIEDYNDASLALFESAGYRADRHVIYVSRRDTPES